MNDDKMTENMSGSRLCRHYTLNTHYQTYQIRGGANSVTAALICDTTGEEMQRAARASCHFELVQLALNGPLTPQFMKLNPKHLLPRQRRTNQPAEDPSSFLAVKAGPPTVTLAESPSLSRYP